jgi:hypothetical protein
LRTRGQAAALSVGRLHRAEQGQQCEARHCPPHAATMRHRPILIR